MKTNRYKLIERFERWYSDVFDKAIWPRAQTACRDPEWLRECREWARFAYRHVAFDKMKSTGVVAERHTRYAVSFLFVAPVAVAFAVVLTGSSAFLSATAAVCAILSAFASKRLLDGSFGEGSDFAWAGMDVISPDDGTLEWFMSREWPTIAMAGVFRLMKFGEVLTERGRRGSGRAFIDFERRMFCLGSKEEEEG